MIELCLFGLFLLGYSYSVVPIRFYPCLVTSCMFASVNTIWPIAMRISVSSFIINVVLSFPHPTRWCQSFKELAWTFMLLVV